MGFSGGWAKDRGSLGKEDLNGRTRQRRVMGRAGAFQPTARPAPPSPTVLLQISRRARKPLAQKDHAPSRSDRSQSPSSRLWEGNTAALAGAVISAATKVMERAATAISRRRRMAEEIIGETPLRHAKAAWGASKRKGRFDVVRWRTRSPLKHPRLAGNAKLAQIFVRVGGYVNTLMPRSPREPLDTGKLQLFTDLAKELVAFIDRGRAAAAR